jgi:uracil phosphoribosyltransferase
MKLLVNNLDQQHSVFKWTGAVDSELTPGFYIVPDLGDAGDLAHESKE